MPKLMASKQLPPAQLGEAMTSQNTPETSSESHENSATKCHTLPGQDQEQAEDGLTNVACSSSNNCGHESSEASAPEPASKTAKSTVKRVARPTEVYKKIWRRKNRLGKKGSSERGYARLRDLIPRLRGKTKVSKAVIVQEAILFIQHLLNHANVVRNVALPSDHRPVRFHA